MVWFSLKFYTPLDLKGLKIAILMAFEELQLKLFQKADVNSKKLSFYSN